MTARTDRDRVNGQWQSAVTDHEGQNLLRFNSFLLLFSLYLLPFNTQFTTKFDTFFDTYLILYLLPLFFITYLLLIHHLKFMFTIYYCLIAI